MGVKVKRIKKTNVDKESMGDISNLLDRLFGEDAVMDPDIIHSRCINIKTYLNKFKILIEIFYKHKIIEDICDTDDQLRNDYKSIEEFIQELTEYLSSIDVKYTLDEMKKEKIEVSDCVNGTIYDEEKSKELSVYYTELKSNEFINVTMELLNNLIPHKKYVEDENVHDCKWLENIPGMSYEIFPFTSLNMKFIYTYRLSDNKENEYKNKFLSNLFHKLYKCCLEIHNIVTNVDFDIKKFTGVILGNIDNLKKELPRCKEAFDIISDSLNKINVNFRYYYKDYKSTNDPTIIIQSFIKDIYDDNKNNPIIISQLKRIISYFSNKIKNSTKLTPKLSNLIDGLNDLSTNSNASTDPLDILNTIKTINNNLSI